VPSKPKVGVALIAKDAEESIGACLDSLRPHVAQMVVCVDTLTKDRTAKVAKKHGAEIYQVRVSEPHECPRHGRVMAQDFARARNESFSHLRKDLDWWLWVDADDVLVAAERIPEALQSVPADAIGVWLPYIYSEARTGNVAAPNTVFHRERLLRPQVGWHWQYRVHEVVVPDRQGPWVKTDLVRVVHQAHGHKGQDSASRNLLLLEIELEEHPDDPRTVFYVANQYFAMGRWAEAAEWYERDTQIDKNDYQLWQSYVYLSMSYQKLGDLDAALQAAFGAIDVLPQHPEPYYQLAAIYLQAGEFDKVEYWTEQARTGKSEVPFFVFRNPLDHTFNSRVALADALAQMGRIPEARAELENAHRVFPDERVSKAIEHYRQLEDHEQTARAFVNLHRGMRDELLIAGYELHDLPLEVRAFAPVRDLVMPAYLRQRPNTQPRVVFWAGRSVEEWAPPSLNGSGIGGSETAVIEVARRFAADGWKVDVYNAPGRYEGVYDGVGYWEPSRFDGSERVDVLVSWRNPLVSMKDARVRLLWCHDLNYGPDAIGPGQGWSRVLGVSGWHAGMLSRYYGIDNADYVPNGINLERFDPAIKKVPWRCVYASSPDRGLLRLLSLWPRIVENEPGAELHVAYGWQTFDRMAVDRPDMQRFKAHVMDRIEHTPQVVYRDRLPQNELARLYSESYAWLYPTSFLEVSCISAMEAMAGGAVPVVTKCGALPETIDNVGILVDLPGSQFPAQSTSAAWQEFYVMVARGILADSGRRMGLALAGRERAKELTWDKVYERWKKIVTLLLEGREVTACE
jgi:glycosyltransferase involved in cell wall biosynthesis